MKETTTQIIKKYQINFTQVANIVLEDNNLSIKAKGLYAYLFSKPDGWQFHTDVMQKELQETAGQIRTIIKELIKNGYIARKQFNKNGKFGGIIYEFLEVGVCKNTVCGKNRMRENPYAEKTVCGKTDEHNNIDNINNIYNINNNNIYNSEPKKKTFTPPTLEECKDYAKELHCKKELGIDFFNYYNLSNWIDGKGKQILRWKQKMYQWYMHDKNKYFDDIPDKPNCPTLEEVEKFRKEHAIKY